MQLRTLGSTDIKIAPLVLGGNVFGWTADKAASFSILDAFLSQGFNAIDTADVYNRYAPGLKGGESETIIGDGNYIMTSGHIAHNCRIGNRTVICSCALVAGYVEVEDQAFISGGVVVHQYSKIGRLAMIGGNTRVNSDVPPFFLYSGFNVAAKGLNLVGLKRAGYKHADIAVLKKAYQILYRSGLKLEEALARIESEIPTPETRHLVEFVRRSERGICRE